MKDKIPVEDMKRIDDAAIDAASAYSPDHSFGHIAREYYRKGRIDEYLHSLQQKKDGVNSAIIACGDLVECLTRPPAGPVWVKASDRLPDDTITKAARFRYPSDYTYSSLTVEDDRIFIGEETTWVIKEVPKVVLEYWEWLDESPSPRKEIPRPAGEARANIPEGCDEWCEAHQSYYKDECAECSNSSPRAAADREKEIALAFHKWVVEKDIWWEDEDEYWYKSISISESLHGNYTEYEKVCETDDQLYDLFLQSNP